MMSRNLKVLSAVALLASMLMGATSASAQKSITADATTFTVPAGETTRITTKADGSGSKAHHVFDVPGNGSITCERVELEGALSGTEPGEAVLAERAEGPSFTGCTFLGQPATVNLNGCSFTFTPEGEAAINCPEGKSITFSAGGCTVTVKGGQSFKGAVKYTNVNGQTEITAELATTAIHTVPGGAGCITTGTFTTGQFTTGNTLVEGEPDPNRKSITADATTFTVPAGETTRITTKADGSGSKAHHVFDVPGNGSITCQRVELEGTLSGTEPGEAILAERAEGPSFTGCTFLGQPATVNLNDCSFTFTPAGEAQINCPVGKSITFSAAGCTVTVKGGQSFKGAVKYTNVNGQTEITAELATTAIHTVPGGAGCITTGTATTGQFTTGNTLVEGEI